MDREFVALTSGASSNKSESIPIISSTYIFGKANKEDLFHSKLLEIDSDIRKFDHVGF